MKTNLQAIIDRVKAKNPAVKIVIAGMQIPPNLGGDYARRVRGCLCRAGAREQRRAGAFLARRRGRPSRSEPGRSHASDRRRSQSGGGKRLARARAASRKDVMRLDGCHALVTGASAGIGREFARATRRKRASTLRPRRPPASAAGGIARGTARASSATCGWKFAAPICRKPEAVEALIAWATTQKPGARSADQQRRPRRSGRLRRPPIRSESTR